MLYKQLPEHRIHNLHDRVLPDSPQCTSAEVEIGYGDAMTPYFMMAWHTSRSEAFEVNIFLWKIISSVVDIR